MSTREKILILLTTFAVGAGLFYNLRPSSRQGVAWETPEERKALAVQFVEESRASVAGVALAADQRYAQAGITTAWPGNPFAKRAVATSLPEELELTAAVNYSGYVNVGGQLFALIDGHAYQPGDLLTNLVYRIRSIAPEQVVLDATDGHETLAIKFKQVPNRRRE